MGVLCSPLKCCMFRDLLSISCIAPLKTFPTCHSISTMQRKLGRDHACRIQCVQEGVMEGKDESEIVWILAFSYLIKVISDTEWVFFLKWKWSWQSAPVALSCFLCVIIISRRCGSLSFFPPFPVKAETAAPWFPNVTLAIQYIQNCASLDKNCHSAVGKMVLGEFLGCLMYVCPVLFRNHVLNSIFIVRNKLVVFKRVSNGKDKQQMSLNK